MASIFKDKRGDLCIEDAHIFYRNFSGNAFGKGGAKGFCLRIEDETWAETLEKEGWNLKKKTNPKDPDDEPTYYIPVAVNYNERFNPNIYMYNGHSKVRCNNDTVIELDMADIEHIDLIVHPRKLVDERTNETRIKAYVKTMHVTLVEDPFGDKYGQYDRNAMDAEDDLPYRN